MEVFSKTSDFSFEKRSFKITGVKTEEQIIKRITAVKYSAVIIPAAKHFWVTIKATSPRVIMPTPIFRESLQLNLHIFAMRPQPIILEIKATRTKARQNNTNVALILSKVVFNPMPTKNVGAKIM